MKQKILRATGVLSRVGLGAVALLAGLAMLLLSVGSLLTTADMRTDNPMQELVTFLEDPLPRNLLMLILMAALAVSLLLLLKKAKKLTERIRLWMPAVALGVWVAFAGCLWVAMSLSLPTHDSYLVTRAGVAAAEGDLSFIQADYFIRFPFQLGYVFWTELWARLLDLTHADYIALEIINVLCLAFGEAALVLITDRLFGKREITLVTTLALALFFQPVIFTTFLYGTIPGFCFAAWSIYFFIRYLQTDKWGFMIPTALFLSLSVSLKLNNMILLVAMGIILLAHLMKDQPLRRALAALLLCVTALILPNIGKWQYSLRADKDFGDGIPMVSWLAMGLHEATPGPGWYNGVYTVTNFHNHGMDSDAAGEASKEVIAKRLEEMKQEPAAAAEFFHDKILSQWSEPTYQSIWNNQVRGQAGKKWGKAAYICGEGEDKTTRIMDYGVQFIFCGMTLATVFLFLSQLPRKKDRRSDEAALFLIPLLFLGGFLYHALFEAKSQYVITYVTFMIPYAVWGIARLCESITAGGSRLLARYGRGRLLTKNRMQAVKTAGSCLTAFS